jgi:imidazolonepropionase-like amidohydrolase
MATLNGAFALGQAGRLGEIFPGAFADLVAFPHEPGADSATDPYHGVVHSHLPPSLLLVNGRPVQLRASSRG